MYTMILCKIYKLSQIISFLRKSYLYHYHLCLYKLKKKQHAADHVGDFRIYSLIAFDERVTFWLQHIRSLPCACAYVALFGCRLAYNHYAIAHA